MLGVPNGDPSSPQPFWSICWGISPQTPITTLSVSGGGFELQEKTREVPTHLCTICWGGKAPQGEKNKAKVIHPKPDQNGATNLHPCDDHPNVHPNGPGSGAAATGKKLEKNSVCPKRWIRSRRLILSKNCQNRSCPGVLLACPKFTPNDLRRRENHFAYQ